MVTFRSHAWFVVLLAGMIVLEAQFLPDQPSAASVAATARRLPDRTAAFPPPPVHVHYTRHPKHASGDPDLDRRIREWGQAAPNRGDPVQRDFERTDDALAFALRLLPAARRGDGAAAYFIYLSLGLCHTYLRLDAAGARALSEQMENDVESLSAEERDDWQAEYQRCAGFARGDWSPLATALGRDRPGAETEVGSVWFERAVAAGYAPALAEQALRPGPLGEVERGRQLRRAVASGNPHVYWLLFADDPATFAGQATVRSLAWLLAACHGGDDCGEQASWYRGYVCVPAGLDCQRGESGLEHYWYSLSAWERSQAYRIATDIEAAVRRHDFARLPWPDLAGRDTGDDEALWTAEALSP